jgi:hypothetical protein
MLHAPSEPQSRLHSRPHIKTLLCLFLVGSFPVPIGLENSVVSAKALSDPELASSTSAEFSKCPVFFPVSWELDGRKVRT